MSGPSQWIEGWKKAQGISFDALYLELQNTITTSTPEQKKQLYNTFIYYIDHVLNSEQRQALQGLFSQSLNRQQINPETDYEMQSLRADLVEKKKILDLKQRENQEAKKMQEEIQVLQNEHDQLKAKSEDLSMEKNRLQLLKKEVMA